MTQNSRYKLSPLILLAFVARKPQDQMTKHISYVRHIIYVDHFKSSAHCTVSF